MLLIYFKSMRNLVVDNQTTLLQDFYLPSRSTYHMRFITRHCNCRILMWWRSPAGTGATESRVVMGAGDSSDANLRQESRMHVLTSR